jgi:acetoacetyl-CoA synthetase
LRSSVGSGDTGRSSGTVDGDLGGVVGVGTGWHGAGVSTAEPSVPAVLWRPTAESIRGTRVAAFADWVAARRGRDFGDPVDHDTLWRWSVGHLEQSWSDLAAWSGALPGVPDDGS